MLKWTTNRRNSDQLQQLCKHFIENLGSDGLDWHWKVVNDAIDVLNLSAKVIVVEW